SLNEGTGYAEFDPQHTSWATLVRQENAREALKDRVTKVFKDTAKHRLAAETLRRHDGVGEWQFTPEKQLQIGTPFRIRLNPEAKYPMLEGQIVTQTRLPIDPAGQYEAPEWQVVDVFFTRAVLS